MLRAGAPAPSFQGVDAEGRPISLEQFRGHPLVLYFYPKAGTAGCSAEARGFAQHYRELQAAGLEVVGVSVDTVLEQRTFSSECALPFRLVADSSKAIAREYGVIGLLGLAKRVTFFIGPDGRIEEVLQGILPGPHVRRAIARAGRSAATAGGPAPRNIGSSASPPGGEGR